MCLKIYELDPTHFLSTRGLAWQAALKKIKEKLDTFTDTNLLLMIEAGIRGGICHAVYQYLKTNKKYINPYDKNKDSSYLKYWEIHNFYGWTFSQKLLVNDLKWVEDISQLTEYFIQNYNDDNNEVYFFEADV